MSNSIPKTFYGPISHQVMTDPVICPDGHSYERHYIEQWITQNSGNFVSPMTGVQMHLSVSQLIPNIGLRQTIQEFLKKSSSPASAISKVEAVPLELTYKFYSGKVHLKIKAPMAKERAPADIVIVIDKSGSMEATAQVKDASGKTIEYGLTILDVVKHAVRTVISMLNPKDRVCIVAYDSTVTQVFRLNTTNPTNKQSCLTQLERLSPGTSTNLWGGLHEALRVLTENRILGRNASILFFTDGIPNLRPARPESEMLRLFNIEHKTNFSIHFYGFGYSMESHLLKDCANYGSGSYCFIPDGSFVGTIFTNAVANILSVCGERLQLQVNSGTICGGHQILDGWTDLGPIMYGQTRDVIIECQNSTEVMLRYHSFGQPMETKISLTKGDFTNQSSVEFNQQLARLTLIRVIQTCMLNPLSATELIKEAASQLSQNPQGKLYLSDLSGQVLEAFTGRGYFDKWGRHYLPSVVRTQQLQQRNNFKDFSVQDYGSQMSKLMADQAEQLFNQLAPPKPSARTVRSAPMTTMRSMNVPSGPCFHGNCYTKMADGSCKILSDLKKGDYVLTPFGSAQILCVIKTNYSSGEVELVHLDNDLKVTPWHPVVNNGKWSFPINLATPKLMAAEAIYSFVLDQHHIMEINGRNAICLGHNYQNDPVLKHPYFGSDKVLKDLSTMKGWDQGLIELKPNCLIRENQLVVKMIQEF